MEKRDYNIEINDTADHRYAYGFDLDVIHPYMLKSFAPFFKNGNILELGSHRGDFTSRLLEYFPKIKCIEASDIVALKAKEKLGDKIDIIISTFEETILTEKYDNIILTHVLEHVDDQVSLLRKINDEWLSDIGRLFIVCPNANAASRRIAVNMGLMDHTYDVTDSEKKHGHTITYSLSTLQRDVELSGLNVIHSSGIFFKAFASYQWDKILNTDIISQEYLEGCYQLGLQYPDLCSSIFILCEKNKSL